MTDEGEGQGREEAFYEAAAAFLKRNGFLIAVFTPVAVVSLVPAGTAGPLIILLAYLGEAIVYAAIKRAGRGDPSGQGIRSGPGPGLQAIYGLLAATLIIGGIFGLATAGDSPPILAVLALTLGIGIVVWVWRRVSRASGERTSVFAARLAGATGQTGRSAIDLIVARLIVAAVVAVIAWLISIATNLFGGS